MYRISLSPKDAFTWYFAATLSALASGLALMNGGIRIAGMVLTRESDSAVLWFAVGTLAVSAVGFTAYGVIVQRRNRMAEMKARAAAISAIKASTVEESAEAMREALRIDKGEQ